METERFSAEEIIIFTSNPTGAEEREVVIERGRFKSPTSAEVRAIIKEKNKMESEIGEYQKTLDEMSTAMANLHQEDYMGAPFGSRNWRVPASNRGIL